jgi:hypothetical protein
LARFAKRIAKPSYEQALKELWGMIGEDVKISVLVEGRVLLASFAAKLLPPGPVPKVAGSRAKTLPAIEGPKESAISLYEGRFIEADYLYESGPLRIRFEQGVDVLVARMPDYSEVLKEAHELAERRKH